MGTHVGQLALVLPRKHAAHVLQNSLPPLSRFRNVSIVSVVLVGVLQHICRHKWLHSNIQT